MSKLLLLLLLLSSVCIGASSSRTSTASSAIATTTTTASSNGNHDENENNNNSIIDVVIGIDGGTESIRACCFHARTGRILGSPRAFPYETSHPFPGWAEQHPREWYECLTKAVRGAMAGLNNDDDDDDHDGTMMYRVRAICCDTTCCSVVALSSDLTPLRPCLLWMDARSAVQARRILEICNSKQDDNSSNHDDVSLLQQFPSLRVNSAGRGPISAEWLLPKAMWIKTHEPRIYEDARVICEYQDYINWRLTGRMVASSCNAAARWHHDGWDVLDAAASNNTRDEGNNNNDDDDDATTEDESDETKKKHAGRPMALYRALNMTELADKLPRTTLAMGDVVGGLTEEAAEDLGLPVGTLVVQGGPDAFVGMIGLGAIHPHDLCLITGSSHLHCLITPRATSAPGTWGAYRGAPLPHLNFAEGGQSSTGSLVRWVRDLISNNGNGNGGDEKEKVSYRVLDEEAELISPGSDGLVALETWQGSRTPHTDPLARGAFVGLTLSHTRAHMFRAILESVCYGTRSCFDALEAAAEQHSQSSNDDDDNTIGTTTTSSLASAAAAPPPPAEAPAAPAHKSNEVVIAGGATRSPLWLQLHADITGRTFLLNENTDGPLLGCAILASVGAGIHGSVEEAVEKMVRRERRIEPREEVRKVYDELYENVYSKVRLGVKEVVHAMAEIRGGAFDMDDDEGDVEGVIRSGISHAAQRGRCGKWGMACLDNLRGGSIDNHLQQSRTPIISPSLLASDWSDMKGEVQKCIDAGLTHLHIDVFDGVFLDSPHALTFGPQMVEAIHQRFIDQQLTLDIHLCVDRPARYVKAMAEAGATRIIFQWEAMGNKDENGACSDSLSAAIELASAITSFGMKCGVSINPETPVSTIYPLLDTGFVDLVDILAVEPGFGGQIFNPVALQKIVELRQWRNTQAKESGTYLTILVDGGINLKTSQSVLDAGADILVAGTALFRHPRGFPDAVKELL